MVSFDDVFSVYALFVLFRESLEASIICAVLLQFLNRTCPREKRQVWYGLAAGVGGAVIFGIIFVAIFYTAKENIFSGTAKMIFRAVICWTACIIITMLAFAMLRFMGWETKLRRKMEGLVAKAAAKKLQEEEAAAAQLAADEAEAAALAPPGSGSPRAGSSSSGGKLARDSAAKRSSSEAIPMPECIAFANNARGGGSMTLALAPAPPAAFASAAGDEPLTVAAPGGGASTALLAPAAGDVEDPKDGAEQQPVATAADLVVPWKDRFGIFFVIFITVLREGIESVVFLAGVGNAKPSAIPLAGIIGILLGVLFGVFLYYTGKTVRDIKYFMIGMAVVLFFIAAGQAELGTYLLMHAEAFGHLDVWIADRPWWMVPQWDWSGCCSQHENRFFGLANAVFGYVAMPTGLEVIVYCCYWAVVVLLVLFKWWRGTLLDADYKHTRMMKQKAAEEAEATRLAVLKGDLEDGDSGSGDADAKDVKRVRSSEEAEGSSGSSGDAGAAAAGVAAAAAAGGDAEHAANVQELLPPDDEQDERRRGLLAGVGDAVVGFGKRVVHGGEAVLETADKAARAVSRIEDRFPSTFRA